MAPPTGPPPNGPPAAPSATTSASRIATKPVIRKRIEPAIPLPLLQRRPKQGSISAPIKRPHQPNNENLPVPPLPTQNGQPKLDEAQAPPMPNSDNEPADKIAVPQRSSETGETRAKMGAVVSSPEERKSPVPVGVAPRQGATSLSSPGEEVTRPCLGSYQTGILDASSRYFSDDASSAPSSASFRPHAISPPPNHFPPPFHPATSTPMHFRGPVPAPIRLPQHNINNSHSHIHHHHLSNGSLIFGGFNGSNTTSPAPNSGGIFPPPPPMSQHPAECQAPVTGVDEYGRPIMAPAPLDGSMPMNYGPNTPHSFHGSQTSRHVEDNGFAPQPVGNGQNVNGLGPQGLRHNHDVASYPQEILDRLSCARIISNYFGRHQFADCELVLAIPDRLTTTNSQFPGKPNVPLRLPAHRMVLSFNSILEQLMAEQSVSQSREFHIFSDDPYLRADAFWKAIQYFYGMRPSPTLPSGLDQEPDVEKFHFALAYAAAGAFLEAPQISVDAVLMASRWLSWDTVELGLEFALTGVATLSTSMSVPDVPFTEFRYKHGIYVNQLVLNIVNFLIAHFPRDFALDTTVSDPQYARLPSLPSFQGGQTNSGRNPSVSQSTGRPSTIQFGDMAPAGSGMGGFPADHSASQSSASRHRAALSRILTNLPFTMLKYILESRGLANVVGLMTMRDRHRIMSQVITARETRRLQVLDEKAAGRLEGPVIAPDISGHGEPQIMDGVWNNVYWRELCVGNGTPVMTRQWAAPSENEVSGWTKNDE